MLTLIARKDIFTDDFEDLQLFELSEFADDIETLLASLHECKQVPFVIIPFLNHGHQIPAPSQQPVASTIIPFPASA